MTKVVYIISDINKALAFEWIADRLNKEQFEISFVLLLQQPAELAQWCKKKGIDCTSLFYEGKKDFPRLLWQLTGILRKKKPRAVHCHLLYGSLFGLTAAWIAGIKQRIYTRHHSDYHQRYFPKGIKWDKWCNRLATTIVAPSQSVFNVLTKMEGVAPQKIKVVHHGFDLDYFANPEQERVESLKEKYKTFNHFPVVGVISRFTELKGIQYIIPAFKDLLIHYPNALLMLFNARGDYEDTLTDMLAEHLPEANYRTVAFENDLASVYGLFDLFTQVSTDRNIEAFGQTYVEALAAGVPSVFTLSGIANDFIVNEENALVVPFKNSKTIFQQMKTLLETEKLRTTLARNGRVSVRKRFSIERMIKNLEQLYARN